MRTATILLMLSLTWTLAACEGGPVADPTARSTPVKRSSARSGGAHPAVFSTASYESAKSDAERSNRLFIVDATAVWCGPCKMMDRTTWVHADVESWIEQHAVAVQVDVDKQKKIAQELRITAMPTVVVFKDGREIDRSVGYQSASQLLRWLEGVQQGRRAG